MKTIHTKRKELITERLTAAFAPTFLEVVDESHKHIGHAGAKMGASHFAIIIESIRFQNLTLVKRHQMIYDVLHDLIPQEIHALKITARCPE